MLEVDSCVRSTGTSNRLADSSTTGETSSPLATIRAGGYWAKSMSIVVRRLLSLMLSI